MKVPLGFTEKDIAEGKKGPLGKTKCPYFRDYMCKVCSSCVKWMYLDAKDVNGQPYRVYHCADIFALLFQMENNKFMNSLGATQDDTRNILSDATGKPRKPNRFYHGPNDNSIAADARQPKQIGNRHKPSIIDEPIVITNSAEPTQVIKSN